MRALVFISSLIYGFVCFADPNVSSRTVAEDLYHDSTKCERIREATSVLDPRSCELTVDMKSDLGQALMTRQHKLVSDRAKKAMIDQVRESLKSQVEVSTWLFQKFEFEVRHGGKPYHPLNGEGLAESVAAAKDNCQSISSSSGYEQEFNQLQSVFENEEPSSQLGLGALTTDGAEKAKDFLLRRHIVAAFELTRIENELELSLDDRRRQALVHRKYQILETYPVLGQSERTRAAVSRLFGSGSKYDEHPNIEKILFPEEQADGSYKYAELPSSNRQSQNKTQNAIEMILHMDTSHDPFATKSRRDRWQKFNDIMYSLRSDFNQHLKDTLASVGALCQADPCATTESSPGWVAQSINQVGSLDEKKLTLAAACRCDIQKRSEYVPWEVPAVLSTVSLIGWAACPYTLGVGCGVGLVAGAGAIGTSAANVVGGLQDRSRLSKVTPVVAALPSSIVSEKERAAVFSRAADADRRIVLNAVGVAPAIAAGPKWLLYSGRAGKSYFGGLSVPKVAPKDGKQVFDAIGTFDDLPQIPANQLTSLRQFRATDSANDNIYYYGQHGGKDVFVKTPHADDASESYINFFLKEAKLYKMMNDLGIGPRMTGVTTIDGRPALVIERIDGVLVKGPGGKVTSEGLIIPTAGRRHAALDDAGIQIQPSAIQDIRETVRRLEEAGVQNFMDLQFMISRNGQRATLIDPAGFNFTPSVQLTERPYQAVENLVTGLRPHMAN